VSATATLLERFGRRLRLGMVGGGADSVIGGTHRVALRVDGRFDLVAGAMSIVPDIARATARADLIGEERTYTDYVEMAHAESELENGIDAVVIATPPQTHLAVAKAFLERGIDVICEKPMTKTAAEAEELAELVGDSGRLFLLTHCYTGYPMVREARSLVGSGAIGEVTIADVEFASGDPGVALEPADPAARHWRFRPESMGPAAILGEVGSHAHNLAEFVTGATVTRVSARMQTFAARREVYDNAFLTVEFGTGAVGRLWSSYVASGNEHGLAFRIFGTEGSLLWRQEEPEVLWHQPLGKPAKRLSRGGDGLSAGSLRATRFRPGHPEGYALAFANLYADFADAVLARSLGEPFEGYLDSLPSVADGVATLRLLEAAERSHEADGAWQEVAG
jgi:predicted dehydrogenase